MNTSHKTRILILGGGFGGLYAALHLDKTIAADPNVEVTLVSRENFVLFTPMLHEVAAGNLEMTDIVSPLRQMLKHVNFLEAEVESIDLVECRVTLAYGLHHQQKNLAYDHLLIALGSETNFFKLPGVEERALTMKSLGDAVVLRNHMLATLEMASLVEDAAARRAMLTFVVAGGGFAGVETIGAVNDFVREAVIHYPNLREDDVRVVLIHPNAVILPELGESLGRYAQRKLASREVEIRTETRVTAFSDHGVELGDGETIAAHTLVWTAGVTPPAVLRTCHAKRKRVVSLWGRLWKCPAFLEFGPLGIAPGFRIRRPATPTRQPRSTLCERRCTVRRTLSQRFVGNGRHPLLSLRSVNSRRLVVAPVSPASWASTCRGFLRGGCGGRSTSPNCRASRKSCAWHCIGPWTCFSPRTSCSM